MKQLTTIIALLLFVNFITAQDFRFGKVSKEELQEKVHPLDADANAAILSKEEQIYFIYTEYDGYIQHREVTVRIKIYNKEGYKWATNKIYMYQGSNGSRKEKLSGLKGHTFNLINGKAEKTKLKNDGIFEEDYNDFTKVTTITMPDINDGSIIEYTYDFVSPFYGIDDLVFQSTIPINNLSITVTTPKSLRYNKVNNPKAFYFPENSQIKDNEVTISETNIPALKEEAFTANMSNYVSKMGFELVALMNSYGAIRKSYATSWDEVSNTIYKYPSFGEQLNKTKFFESDIASITSGVSNTFEKAMLLSNHVKKKVKWNGSYGFSSQKGIKDAYNEGEGNVGDINLLLISMLKSQGINANPVLVSTKNNGIPLYPTTKGFNYVICLVQDQDQYVLIDATEKYSSLNVLPIRAINWQGRLVRQDGTSTWISLSPTTQSIESASLNVKIEDDLSISGKAKQVLTSNLALNYRKRFTGVSEDDKIKAVEKDKGDVEISNLEVENMDNNLSVSYNYKLNAAIDDIGGKLYFSPLLFMAEKENPFKLNERKYPIDFSIPLKNKCIVNIMLPDGYKVEALPQSEKMNYKEGAVSYTFVAKLNGKFIQLSTEFDFKTSIIDPADYTVFKEFYGKVVEKQAEKIVLTKE